MTSNKNETSPTPSRYEPTRSQVVIPGSPILHPPEISLIEYLRQQLRVKKLNDIHRHLWWAGRPGNIHPLHAQLLMKRDILISEDTSLHLIWFDTTIYLKPLPAFLLDDDFFSENILRDPELFGLSMGFLKTYTRLVVYQSDFRIAKKLRLLPDTIGDWETWYEKANEILSQLGRYDSTDSDIVNKRYWYGELRLRRLNHIRMFCRAQRPYRSLYVQFDQFFNKKFAWLLLVVVYLGVVLGAFQVILGSNKASPKIIATSYWASIATLLLVVGSIALQFVMFVVLFLYHCVGTIQNVRKKRVESIFGNPQRLPENLVAVAV